MGAVNSVVTKHLDTEFDRVLAVGKSADAQAGSPRDSLVLEQVLEIRPPEDYPVKLAHVGTLYLLDRSLSGRVSREDVSGARARAWARADVVAPVPSCTFSRSSALQKWSEARPGSSSPPRCRRRARWPCGASCRIGRPTSSSSG